MLRRHVKHPLPDDTGYAESCQGGRVSRTSGSALNRGLTDAALEDVLDQLLRTENHTVLYRASAQARSRLGRSLSRRRADRPRLQGVRPSEAWQPPAVGYSRRVLSLPATKCR